MPEVETPVRSYQVDYTCDECESGEMLYSNNASPSAKAYFHQCTHCSHVQAFDQIYPRLEVKPLDG